MNVYEALVKWWRGNPQHSEKHLAQWHFVHHKYRIYLPETEPWWGIGDYLHHGMAIKRALVVVVVVIIARGSIVEPNDT
jgi:hypothetical protein